MTTSPYRGIAFMVISAVLFASMGACLKSALTEIPVFEAVFFRSIISVLLIGLIIYGRKLPYLGQNRRFLLARSLSGFVAMSCGFYALAHIPLADAAVLHHSSPLFVALFGAVLLRERVTRALTLYIVVALLGVILVLQPQGKMFNVYGVVAVIGAAFAGLAYIFVRHLHQTESSWLIAFHFTSITSLLSLPLMIANFVPPSLFQWSTLIAAGVLGTGGQIFMTVAYRYEAASRLAPFSYVAVAVAVCYGILFWNEVPNFYAIMGILLIMVMGMAIARHNLRGRRVVAIGDDA